MKRDGFNHTKARMLCNLLGLPGMWAAHGLMESLWQLTEREAPQGDIGKRTDAMIAAGLDWRDEPEKLISALVESGLLDRHPTCRLAVHDWHQHADAWVKKKLQRAGLRFVAEWDDPPDGQSLQSDHAQTEGPRGRGEARRGEARPGGGPGEGVAPWDRPGLTCYPQGAIAEIRREYPNRRRGGVAGDHAAIDAVLCQLADRGESDPAAWLLAKVRLYAGSWQAGRGEFTPKLKTWCAEGVWDQEPDEWAKPEGSDFDPSAYAEEVS